MVADTEKYSQLIQQFEQISQSYIRDDELDKLKVKYKEEIKFKRELEAIIDISSLLQTLQKLGLLQYDDINVLKEIASDFMKDESVQKLIIDYEEWLNQNSSKINYLYSGGKSNMLNNKNHNITPKLKIEVTRDPHILLSTVIKESEEISLLTARPTEIHNIDINNTNYIENSLNFSKKFRRKYLIITIFFLLICILIGIVWILVKLSHQSIAIVPKANSVIEQSESKMPFNISHSNVGISVQSSTTINQNLNPTGFRHNNEKELQNIIVTNLGKRIGRFWRDVSRLLDVQESAIEEIERQYSNDTQSYYSEKFKKAMKLYFMENHSNWKTELMRALESSRRGDLKNIVEDIILK